MLLQKKYQAIPYIIFFGMHFKYPNIVAIYVQVSHSFLHGQDVHVRGGPFPIATFCCMSHMFLYNQHSYLLEHT